MLKLGGASIRNPAGQRFGESSQDRRAADDPEHIEPAQGVQRRESRHSPWSVLLSAVKLLELTYFDG
jgi:hypothetical protein